MKGIVFTEFIELVEQRFSAPLAYRLLDECELPSGGAYTAVGTYDHRELVSLVSKLSEISGLPLGTLMTIFTEHLFDRFLVLYPVFFEGVHSALDFLAQVEDFIHPEVLKLYPDAELPRFEIQRPDRVTLVMTYHSTRHLGDFAQGLIEACIKHFNETIQIGREDLSGAAQVVRFTLRQVA